MVLKLNFDDPFACSEVTISPHLPSAFTQILRMSF